MRGRGGVQLVLLAKIGMDDHHTATTMMQMVVQLTCLLRLVQTGHVGARCEAAESASAQSAKAGHGVVGAAELAHLGAHVAHDGHRELRLEAGRSGAHDLLGGQLHLHDGRIVGHGRYIVDNANVLDVAAAEQDVVVDLVLRRNRVLRFAVLGAVRADWKIELRKTLLICDQCIC